MIYDKDVAFPYPVLTNSSNGYVDCSFEFDINDLYDDGRNFIFEITYNIKNNFIKTLINESKAIIVFIVYSQDNYFKRLTANQNKIIIPKSKISLSNRTTIQLHIQSLEEISMSNCNELAPFYDKYKDQIKLSKHVLLGYSNLVKYQGSEYSSLELFKQSVNREYKNAFEVELNEDSIVLKFNDSKYIIANESSTNLFNMYLFVGLSRALHAFIMNNNTENEEFIELQSLNEHQMNNLDSKLLSLMLNKGIKEIDYESIDSIIAKISNNIIEKYVNSIERIMNYGN
ncbi:hypothetical protein QI050_11075 [Staphylococcus saprophyticus]|uniref:Uncharacterized protein n=2 Tax=Staphylococcus saprophyticus TaxID=29385 RepID=A0A380HIK9_STASA|nr:hypothetical protein [Staphylococcus saprophyticus]MDW4219137.1 hypothetical protein [Staphylococcus saprophyticus]MDW4426194.1 hypothetical protein [Staphylococcus saprophyticus]SUM81701.1 Uncharacterised protein [Staphylococcus saprophyticus]